MFSIGGGNILNLISTGDSQTAERSALGGATLAQTYPFLIAKAKGYGCVTNVGKSGDTLAAMSARMGEVLPHWPGAFSLAGFANDMTTNISGGVWTGGGTLVATSKATAKSAVQTMQARRARVTLLTAVPVFQTVYLNNAAPYVTAFTEIASETGCEFIDVYSNFIAMDANTRNSLLLDDQHPNIAGHAYIASLATGNRFAQF